MPKRGIKKITGAVTPRRNVAHNKENPYSGMDPRARQENLRRDLGRIWASICRRQAEESEEDHPTHHPEEGQAQ